MRENVSEEMLAERSSTITPLARGGNPKVVRVCGFRETSANAAAMTRTATASADGEGGGDARVRPQVAGVGEGDRARCSFGAPALDLGRRAPRARRAPGCALTTPGRWPSTTTGRGRAAGPAARAPGAGAGPAGSRLRVPGAAPARARRTLAPGAVGRSPCACHATKRHRTDRAQCREHVEQRRQRRRRHADRTEPAARRWPGTWATRRRGPMPSTRPADRQRRPAGRRRSDGRPSVLTTVALTGGKVRVVTPLWVTHGAVTQVTGASDRDQFEVAADKPRGRAPPQLRERGEAVAVPQRPRSHRASVERDHDLGVDAIAKLGRRPGRTGRGPRSPPAARSSAHWRSSPSRSDDRHRSGGDDNRARPRSNSAGAADA